MKVKKWLLASSVALALGTAALPAVYAHGDHEDQVEVNLEEISLNDWEGNWNSESAFYGEEVVKKALEEAAEADGEDPKEFIEAKEKRRHVDFDNLVIEGDTVIFNKEQDGSENNEEIAKNKYKLDRAEAVEHGGSTLHWFVFIAEEEDAEYPYLLLMDIHGEDVLAHFHLRYAKDEEEIEELLEADDWYPEFINHTVTAEQVADAILH